MKFKDFWLRIYHGIMKFAAYFLGIKEPNVITGEKSILKAYDIVKSKNKVHPLIVTDKSIFELGLITPLTDYLNKEKLHFTVFSNVVANPTIDNVEEGLSIYLKNNCDCIIAIGGGSAMDCAKTIGARSANPKKTVSKMKGLLKVGKRIPLFIAVPTTAGTGSETTVAAVIVDKANNDKYAINDPKLIPHYAILDPTLLVGLPKNISATTGMDALTHAVEAYIGHENTKKTKNYALSAIKLIYENLVDSVNDPKNLKKREYMQIAAYKAGVAFTRGYVGSVHALAHSLGGLYNIPHGLANAIILPYMLRQFGQLAYRKLARIADSLNICKEGSIKEKAQAFINSIDELNNKLEVKNTFGHLIKDQDILFLANHSYKEAVPLYPTPRTIEKLEYIDILFKLRENSING